MTSRRRRKSNVLAAQAIDLGFAVPQVVAHRLTRITLAGWSPSVRDRREFYLMGAEKMAAVYESWNAMLLEILRASWQLAVSPTPFFWCSFPLKKRSSRAAAKHFQQAALSVLGKGVAPIHRRAVANVRRLRRGR